MNEIYEIFERILPTVGGGDVLLVSWTFIIFLGTLLLGVIYPARLLIRTICGVLLLGLLIASAQSIGVGLVWILPGTASPFSWVVLVIISVALVGRAYFMEKKQKDAIK